MDNWGISLYQAVLVSILLYKTFMLSERVHILRILSLSIHEHGTSFHLFRSYIFFISVLICHFLHTALPHILLYLAIWCSLNGTFFHLNSQIFIVNI